MEREVYDMNHLINKTNQMMFYVKNDEELEKIEELLRKIQHYLKTNKMVIIYRTYNSYPDLHINNFLEADLIAESELNKYIQKKLTYIKEPNKKANKIEKLYFWNQISCDPTILSPNILRNADGELYDSMDDVLKDFKYIWNKKNKTWQDKTKSSKEWNIQWNMLSCLCDAFEEYIKMHGYQVYKSHWDDKFPKIYKY